MNPPPLNVKTNTQKNAEGIFGLLIIVIIVSVCFSMCDGKVHYDDNKLYKVTLSGYSGYKIMTERELDALLTISSEPYRYELIGN